MTADPTGLKATLDPEHNDFTDTGQIDSWALGAMTLLVETGTVTDSGGLLIPLDTTTCAQMAQVLYNLLAG